MIGTKIFIQFSMPWPAVGVGAGILVCPGPHRGLNCNACIAVHHTLAGSVNSCLAFLSHIDAVELKGCSVGLSHMVVHTADPEAH